jgi:hypothetical protein
LSSICSAAANNPFEYLSVALDVGADLLFAPKIKVTSGTQAITERIIVLPLCQVMFLSLSYMA